MCEHNRFFTGDQVKVYDQAHVGEIVAIIGERATIAFEHIVINLPLNQLKQVTPGVQDTAYPLAKKSTPRVMNLSAGEFSSFSPAIDLHGMYVTTALEAIDRWIDKALLLGHQRLKIIHGKGSGILRREIRAYLQGHDRVNQVITQHPYRGGEGGTLVELD